MARKKTAAPRTPDEIGADVDVTLEELKRDFVKLADYCRELKTEIASIEAARDEWREKADDAERETEILVSEVETLRDTLEAVAGPTATRMILDVGYSPDLALRLFS
jgi:chromosome segregation ATPase